MIDVCLNYIMNMVEIILWTALGFAPTMAGMMTAWNVAQKGKGIAAEVAN